MKWLLLMFPLLLCACAHSPTQVEFVGKDEFSSVPIRDLRPASEKKSDIFSILITSSSYGIMRRGDETLNPPFPQIFRRIICEKLGENKCTDILIYHMVVYINQKSALRQGVLGGTLAGPIGGGVLSAIATERNANLSQSLVDREQFEAADHDESDRALYTDTENPEHASVFVIYIDAEVNGRRLFVKTMAPSKAPEGQNAYSIAVKSAIQYYLSQI